MENDHQIRPALQVGHEHDCLSSLHNVNESTSSWSDVDEVTEDGQGKGLCADVSAGDAAILSHGVMGCTPPAFEDEPFQMTSTCDAQPYNLGGASEGTSHVGVSRRHGIVPGEPYAVSDAQFSLSPSQIATWTTGGESSSTLIDNSALLTDKKLKAHIKSNSFIHPTEYTDRSRLLYHITQLATQLQRAQLLWQEQHSALVILHGRLRLLQQQQSHGHQDQDNTPSFSYSSGPREQAYDGTESNQGELENGTRPSTISIQVPSTSFTAVALAAEDEVALQRAMEQRLPLFDPILAQAQIHRLDDALAHLSLLREAELRRAETAELSLRELRETHQPLNARLDALESQNKDLAHKNASQEAQLAHYALEVERLRMEENRLNRRVTELERFQNVTFHSPSHAIQVRGVPDAEGRSLLGAAPLPLNPAHSHGGPSSAQCLGSVPSGDMTITNLEREEEEARQSLWLTMFWEPMAMAFDAGLTWLRSVEKDTKFLAWKELRYELHDEGTARGKYGSTESVAIGFEDRVLEETDLKSHNCSNNNANNNYFFMGGMSGDSFSRAHGSPSASCSPQIRNEGWRSKDTEWLLLRHQEAELQETRIQLEHAQQHQRTLELEVERFRALYENEKDRATKMAHDHSVQLKMAYQEIKRDREIIQSKLQKDVEQQIRTAFSEGRLFEQHEQHKAKIVSRAPRARLPKT